ncbi:MAG: PepSY domain-containing protein [Gammaproteobacteria bacterium]
MHRLLLATVISMLAVTSLAGTSNAWAYKSEALPRQAKISLKQARALALKAFPGKIVDEELEKEAGGSGLRYSFDIRQGKRIHEVGIDAADGKLLENSDDSSDKD